MGFDSAWVGDRLSETPDALEAMWTGDPDEHRSPLWTVPQSVVHS
ncbi:hypothetical protein [Allokutzneria oryzae]|uniref:Uncharacterized protein n=1 Tax=Allokutzneria oryzae TaxID=1378989 RepID=A0ABV5ZYW7_9PSEU